MAHNIIMPKAGMAMEEGTVVRWMKKAGDSISKGEAIAVIEMAKSEGQIAIDLAAACGLGPRSIYDAAQVRQAMGGVFATEVRMPPTGREKSTDFEYVEL